MSLRPSSPSAAWASLGAALTLMAACATAPTPTPRPWVPPEADARLRTAAGLDLTAFASVVLELRAAPAPDDVRGVADALAATHAALVALAEDADPSQARALRHAGAPWQRELLGRHLAAAGALPDGPALAPVAEARARAEARADLTPFADRFHVALDLEPPLDRLRAARRTLEAWRASPTPPTPSVRLRLLDALADALPRPDGRATRRARRTDRVTWAATFVEAAASLVLLDAPLPPPPPLEPGVPSPTPEMRALAAESLAVAGLDTQAEELAAPFPTDAPPRWTPAWAALTAHHAAVGSCARLAELLGREGSPPPTASHIRGCAARGSWADAARLVALAEGRDAPDWPARLAELAQAHAAAGSPYSRELTATLRAWADALTVR